MRLSRHTIRLGAAALAAAMAAIYYLIGLGVLHVVEGSQDDPQAMMAFGLPAGTMFLVGAVLLVLQDRRVLWIVGAILQVLVFAMYISVAPTRTPSYEVWGITLRIIEIPLAIALAWLALNRTTGPAREPGRIPTGGTAR